MSERVVIDRLRRRRLQRLTGLWLSLACATATAQQVPTIDAARFGDQTLPLIRQVQPRIAYLSVPAVDNPIRAEAITFPGEVFHRTLDQTLTAVGDDLLGERASAGVANGLAPVSALPAAMGRLAQPMQAMAGRDGNAMGATSSIGSAVNSATRDLGGTITRSLAPLTGATTGRGP